MFASTRAAEPRVWPDWFHLEPAYAVDLNGPLPGTDCEINDATEAFPAPPSQLPAGKYRVQALLDHDLDHHSPGRAPGNYYSEVATLDAIQASRNRSR